MQNNRRPIIRGGSTVTIVARIHPNHDPMKSQAIIMSHNCIPPSNLSIGQKGGAHQRVTPNYHQRLAALDETPPEG
jgi:hypothetical protein